LGMNVRDQLLALRKQKAEPAGTETVNGEVADRYVVKGGKAFHLEGDWAVWVGRKTGLPVKVSVETTNFGRARAPVYEAFDWDPEIDAMTFAIDPPAGFTEAAI